MSRAVLLSLIAAFATLPGCGNKPPVDPPLGPETCDNKKDDNGDGKVDCADPKCFKIPRCLGAAEICDNGTDDNSDGKADCLDPMCDGQACGSGCVCIAMVNSESDCSDLVDNDVDGQVDCMDADCRFAASCSDGGSGGGSGGGGSGGAAGGGAGGGAAGGGAGGGAAGGGGGGVGGGGVGGGGVGGGGVGGGGVGGGGVGGGGVGGGGVGGGGVGGGGVGGGGVGGGGVGGGGAGGGGAVGPELLCSDNVDNDLDNKTDCDDPDCVTRSCGMGCTCALNRKVEISCSDGADNDNDGSIDCADSDCVGVGTEICTDGIDNTCDRGVDCGDTKCAGNGACTNQVDGKGCTANNQCAGGNCFTELADNAPNGLCSNAVSCNVAAQTGCNGGVCTENGAFDQCRARCTGTGLGATGKCRPGYACYDPDTNLNNNNSGCVVLCSNDSECAGTAAGWGCNPWSKLCEQKNKGKPKYGATCTSSAQCESGYCDTSLGLGYCYGVCRGDTKSCANDGVCDFDSSYGDNVGYCMDACTSANASGQCTNTQHLCRSRSPILMCICGSPFEFCNVGSNCCSGSCGQSFSNFCD